MATNAAHPMKIRLYYWDCRGRAQSVRYMLEDIAAKHEQVDYKEDFELVGKAAESWPQHKSDQSIAGPFHNLPVLHVNDTHTFGQTLTIGQFLARAFNLYGQLTSSITDENILRTYIDGIVSCAYTDVIIPTLLCIFNATNLDDPNDAQIRFGKAIPSALKSLNALLAQSSTGYFYDQPEPTIADYFAFEAWMIARDYQQRVLPQKDDCGALIKLEQVMRERPALAKYFKEERLPKRFTGSAKEIAHMAELAKAKS